MAKQNGFKPTTPRIIDDLRWAVNRHNIDTELDMPDYVLAKYLHDTLNALRVARKEFKKFINK